MKLPSISNSRAAAGILLLSASLLVSAVAAVCGQPEQSVEPTEPAASLGTVEADSSAAATLTPTSVPPSPLATPPSVNTAVLSDGVELGSSQSASMIIVAEVWVGAEPSSAPVQAFIGDTECARAVPGMVPGVFIPSVTLIIPPSSEVSGCGSAGAQITFTVGGAAARQSVVWRSGVGAGVVLSVGAEGAIYSGRITLADAPAGLRIEPVVGGQVCGRQLNPFQGTGPVYGYVVLVYPNEIRAGCGRPGSVIQFRAIVRDSQTGTTIVLADDLGVSGGWSPGATTNVADTVLTAADGQE